MTNPITNIIKNYYSKFLYFSDKNSFVMDEINELFKLNEDQELNKFIAKSTLLNEDIKDFLIEYLKNTPEEINEQKNLFLNYFNVTDEPINKIDLLNNVLPFNYINNLIIDKSLLKNLDNFSSLRKEINHIEKFILDNKDNPTLNNLSIILINNDTNSGEYNKNKNCITLKTNHLNPSSLYHEFFHLIDSSLGEKYNLNALFSNTNKQIKELPLFNQYVSNLDNYISSSNNGKENLELYYQKYLGKDFEKEIQNSDDIKEKIRNIEYLGIKIIVKKENEEYLGILAAEIYSHVEYAKTGNITPKRNLYSIFSDVLDLELSKSKRYLSKPSEKLARIYQSSFLIDKDSIFPLGFEKKVLIKELNHILTNEINPLLNNKVVTINNILHLRNKFNSNIKNQNHLSI